MPTPQAMVYVGIDPGKTGGIAVLDAEGRVIAAVKMPPNNIELADILRKHILFGRTVVTLEHVRSRPGQSSVATFTFGRGLGWIEGVLAALGQPHTEVTPATWQRRFDCLTAGDKNISKARAARMFPRVDMTHFLADALLIAAYGRLIDRRRQSALRKPR